MQRSWVMKRGGSGHAVAWLVGLLCLVLPAHAPRADALTERASDLLERMSQALRSLDYEGTLVYSHDDRLESLHLAHRIDQGVVRERLISLNGPLRAVTRERDRVMCVLPDGHPISVERQGGAGTLLNAEGIDPAVLGAHYRIEIPGAARVAGRDTDVVAIIPRDELRYGYRFYIDRETALPLKSDLIDRSGQPLEQLMFTTISVAAGGSVGPVPSPLGPRTAPPAQVSGRWRFDAPPPGFQLVRHGVMDHPDGAQVEHFLFTDRLSAYSVYIEPDTPDGLSGSAHIGAVHAAGRQVDGYQVTAVGEVPAGTVEAAIAGARLAEASPR